MFGGMTGNSLGFGQQQAVGGLGGGFNQQQQQGTGNPPFNPTKVRHMYSEMSADDCSVVSSLSLKVHNKLNILD